MNGAAVIRAPELPALLAVVPADTPLGDGLVATAGTWTRDGAPDGARGGARDAALDAARGGAPDGAIDGSRDDAVARFTPRFAAPPGTVYTILARDAATGPWRRFAEVQVPRASVDRSTVVETIDPGVDEIPANLLRFSVTFSAPMSEGGAAAGIQLRDAAGVDLPGALLDMPPELWDRTHRRLTLLLEPGRIKRGLQPNVQAGPPLIEGSTITLVIDPQLQDARGQHLAAGAERVYRIGPPLRSRIDPALWHITWPVPTAAASGAAAVPAADADGATADIDAVRGGAAATLVVRFDRSLDRALCRRYLRVRDSAGRVVEGFATLSADATTWTFVAAAPGIHWSLHVDTRLEDLAGNSVRRVFDRDLSSPADDGITASHVVLEP
ncbi:hypothetical protein [Subtercola endophyticus]|uniref:hypothetical protein n=1 Tax=Subtercola endophyticus TaxID=2895559 RepID=UPI001E4D6472|nr:hypothetical protein [Subtercola endophyticus]UFS59419.1 hypothetical protein LQ955_01060 [Subtercola endophyticus]